MAKKRSDAAGAKTTGEINQPTIGNRPLDPMQEKANGGGHRESRTAPSPSGLSPLEFNARVARKAYELFEARGREEGRDVEDWLEAERLVKEELVQQSQAVA